METDSWPTRRAVNQGGPAPRLRKPSSVPPLTFRGDFAPLVIAAQAGSRDARDELISACLPLLYNIVGRAVGSPADVDDVVQETLLLVLRDLPGLRSPESFRPWLAAVAMHQIGRHRDRWQSAAARTTAIEEAADVADSAPDIERTTVLHMQLAEQRRRLAEASRWLDPDDRTLLSLWWQETAELMSRAEVAEAMGVNVAHAGVRLQRMREQLERCRGIVSALSAEPRCARLDTVVSEWDGQPSTVWRKRIARHIRDCAVCTATTADLIRIDKIITALAVLPVPATLIAALTAKGLLPAAATGAASSFAHAASGAAATGTVHFSLTGKVAAAVAAHPIVSLVAGTVIVAGVVVTPIAVSTPPAEPAPTRVAVAPPTPPRPPATAGSTSKGPAPVTRGPTASSTSGPSPSGTMPVTGRTWTLTAEHSGKLMDVEAQSGTDRAPVVQWPGTGADNQRWQVIDAGGGTVNLKAVHSGKCLDVDARSTTAGAYLQQYRCNNDDNQRFTITPVPVATPAPTPTATAGVYIIRNVLSGLCVDVFGNAATDGTRLVQWTCQGSTNQQWRFTQV
ncbi:sigma-70 family RNA polymerase sigma factor [Dactylosporangium sp. CA-152071]|uniref:sigma-70 family RNA polymerase sigma factor n=1 Tax=Dactylosporangium sp. CA-152071 TaxID=3239933 RepID=UPI003D8E2DEA